DAETNLNAIAKLFEGRATPIAKSFRRTNGSYETRCRAIGFVVPNRITELLDSERKGRMKAISKNILMDTADDSLWDVKEVESDTFIVRKSEEDLSQLLSSLYTRVPGMTPLSAVASAYVEPEQYLFYVDAGTHEINSGFVIDSNDNTTKVVARHDNDIHEIDNRMIIEIVSHVEVEMEKPEGLKVESKDFAEDAKEYYSKIFGWDADYFKQIEEIIDGHAAA
ncbi:MAG TPA: hypothetical protein V6C65_36555, partial [Allocoleopsis sp.]